jgi:hypothetical protein
MARSFIITCSTLRGVLIEVGAAAFLLVSLAIPDSASAVDAVGERSGSRVPTLVPGGEWHACEGMGGEIETPTPVCGYKDSMAANNGVFQESYRWNAYEKKCVSQRMFLRCSDPD